ncbi:MAG TPA: DUF4118 domain-containing protein, partial [Bryobacteraceae bacterium]|nr:DUF4118 domain-containing protein [Bryobacteraceae bacterium]
MSVGREIAFTVAVVAACSAAASVLREGVALANLAMLYLCGVVTVALRCSQPTAVFGATLSAAAFNFFCVPPLLSFWVEDIEYLLTFAAMLMVAMVIGMQTAHIRKQAADAALRGDRSETLYRLSRRLAEQDRVFELSRSAAEYASEVFQGAAVIFLPEEGKISFSRRSSDLLPIARDEQPIAQWVFEHGRKAGRGMEAHGGASALYLPLRGTRDTVGVMALVTENERSLAGEQMQLLEVFVHQTATAIENTRSRHAAQAARAQMQTEQMRSSLLSAVSHDLRTPLASITGAASTLRSQGEKLPPETRTELLDSIADEAERLGRLVSNLLDMTRLESGVELRRDLYPLEEIVGAALQRMERQLGDRVVTTRLPDHLPLVSVDDVLLGQLLVNLLENAVKYT